METNTKQKCHKCASENLIREGWAKVIRTNIYKLYDKVICKECRVTKIIEDRQVDHSTPETRKLATGNYHVNKAEQVVPKKDTPLKKLVKQVNQEINVKDLFAE